jgi:hypothetical protein
MAETEAKYEQARAEAKPGQEPSLIDLLGIGPMRGELVIDEASWQMREEQFGSTAEVEYWPSPQLPVTAPNLLKHPYCPTEPDDSEKKFYNGYKTRPHALACVDAATTATMVEPRTYCALSANCDLCDSIRR